MHSKVDFKTVECIGDASSLGGKHPDPPLEGFPLLAWAVSHPKHGSKVFTEDGKASVEEIAIAACETPSMEAVASKFGTTPDHASQAVDYAIKAGFLGAKK